MWKIVQFCFVLVLLAIAIHGFVHNEALKKTLVQMADQGHSIHGKFKPLKDGLIDDGDYGVVFKGQMVCDNKTRVAMKIIKIKHLKHAQREYEMYSYLKAVDNPEIERFGISNVHYYNKWNDHMITVFSYFDGGNLRDARRKGYFNESIENQYINSLILFREFVLQSKYMHSRGVRHDDVKPLNIMLRRHRSFLIDFEASSKMSEDYHKITFEYGAKIYTESSMRNARCDWESFLYVMCRLNSVPLEWFNNPRMHTYPRYEQISYYSSLKGKIALTIALIKKTIKSRPLKKVFLEFARETLPTYQGFPDYDRLYNTINAEIGANSWFTWLTPNQIRMAQLELRANPLPDIRRIKMPADPTGFNFVYKAPNYTRFY